MSTAPELLAPPPTSAWHMYRALVGVGLVCGLLVVSVFVGTGPRIQRNKSAALEQAVLHVLPGSRTIRSFRWRDAAGFQRLEHTATGDDIVHAGYDAGGQLVGVAVEARGLGYQDVIRVLYGYAPRRNAIVGLRVLESRDTPGLGDRIERDPAFLRNFAALDVSLTPDGSALAHPIEAVKPGAKTSAWQIDTITGATISSSAVATMVGRSAALWIPRIRRALPTFEATE